MVWYAEKSVHIHNRPPSQGSKTRPMSRRVWDPIRPTLIRLCPPSRWPRPRLWTIRLAVGLLYCLSCATSGAWKKIMSCATTELCNVWSVKKNHGMQLIPRFTEINKRAGCWPITEVEAKVLEVDPHHGDWSILGVDLCFRNWSLRIAEQLDWVIDPTGGSRSSFKVAVSAADSTSTIPHRLRQCGPDSGETREILRGLKKCWKNHDKS